MGNDKFCQYPGCSTPLTGRQLRWCSAKHQNDAYLKGLTGDRKTEKPNGRKCRQCGKPLLGKRVKWCTHVCAVTAYLNAHPDAMRAWIRQKRRCPCGADLLMGFSYNESHDTIYCLPCRKTK